MIEAPGTREKFVQSTGASFVETVLLGKRLTAVQLAVFASRTFGNPLLDLAGFDLDQIQKDLVDLKMAQTRGSLGFSDKSFEALWLLPSLGVRHLQRDVAIQRWIEGAKDRAKRPGTDPFLDDEAANRG